MHENAKKNLCRIIESYVGYYELGENVPRFSGEDEVASKLRFALEKYFGEYANGLTLQHIVDVRFTRALHEKFDILPDGKPAKEALSSDFLAEAARSITDWLIHFPRQYEFYVPMPRLWTGWRGAIRLTNGIGFHEFDISTQSKATPVDPDFGGRDFAMAGLFHQYDNNGVYLKITVDGVFSSFANSGAEAQAISRAKQFLLLSKLTSEHFDDCPDPLPPADTGFAIDCEVGATVAAPFSLPASLRACLNVWGRWPWHEDDHYENLDRQGLEADLQISYKPLTPLLEQPNDFQTIMSAAEWAFDAWYFDNYSNAFVCLAIAFEALLGSSGGEAGIATSLSDRLAYSVAGTRTERSEIITKFREFYRARSKLVHGKVTRIGRAEQDLLFWGRIYFLKALEAEVSVATER